MSSDELKIRVLKFMVELLNWGLQICGGGDGPPGSSSVSSETGCILCIELYFCVLINPE